MATKAPKPPVRAVPPPPIPARLGKIPVTVTLDERASAEARRCLESNPHAPVDHLGDLVNAAVQFFADDTDQGKTTRDFVEEARSRRLAKKAA